MLRISISVNPNKDKNLKNTIFLLNLLKKYDNIKVLMSDTLTHPYGDRDAISTTLLNEFSIEYLPEHVMFRKANICVVFGGDGTILKIAKKASQSGAYILGINLGRIGYIAELDVNEISLIERILHIASPDELQDFDDVTIDKRMMLKVEIVHNENVVFTANALNDVVISKGAVSRMAGLKLKRDGKNICTYRADGIIISTPTGSTAYCMSAGGPIIDPRLECICAVPVCPYMCVNSGAIMFSDDSVIEIEFKADKINEAFCTVDGKGAKSITDGDIVRITKSPHYTKLIRLKDNDFYALLNKKMSVANNNYE